MRSNNKLIQQITQFEKIAQTINVEDLPKASTVNQATQFPSIDRAIQSMLGVETDGQLGPLTQRAINTAKAAIGYPAITNEQIFTFLKGLPQYQNKQPINWTNLAMQKQHHPSNHQLTQHRQHLRQPHQLQHPQMVMSGIEHLMTKYASVAEITRILSNYSGGTSALLKDLAKAQFEIVGIYNPNDTDQQNEFYESSKKLHDMILKFVSEFEPIEAQYF